MGNCHGNCFSKPKQSMAEITPYDFIKSTTTVRLYGDPSSSLTLYIHFALLHKTTALQFTPTNDPQPMVQIGSETMSGADREMMLGFIESKFPQPALAVARVEESETAASVVRLVVLQHRSMAWHLKMMVRWSEDLVKRKGRRSGNPAMGSERMEVKKLERSYGQLLEVMVEHAQMEERVIFPLLETAERGLCKAANEEHGRELPLMNGIKEDIKSIIVLDTGSRDYQEALSNLSARLKSLQEHSKEHFREEERDVLPLMEATELSREEELRVLKQCFDVMQGTHSNLFNSFVQGLLPGEAMQYLGLIMSCMDEKNSASMLRRIID